MKITASAFRSLEMGILAEKDPGEQMKHGFLSGYASMEGSGVIPEILVGDFGIEAGQGLVIWKGGGPGKGAEVVSGPKKHGRGILPHRSTEESSYLRGVALTSRIGKSLMVSLFHSTRKADATVDEEGTFTSFYESGLFRTDNELEKYGRVTEQLSGGRVGISVKDGGLGITGMKSAVEGNDFLVFGVDGTIQYPGGIESFGEYAKGPRDGFAFVAGTVLPFWKIGSILLLYRNYSESYMNRHAFGFGERADTRNERGFYLGIQIHPARWIDLGGYVDQYTFPSGTPSLMAPSSATDLLVETTLQASRTIDVSFRFSRKQNSFLFEGPGESGWVSTLVGDRFHDRFRVTLAAQLSRRIRWKVRVEAIQIHQSTGTKENGIMMYQDLQLKTLPGLIVEGRIALFHTPSYDARIYEYENDLKGVFSNPALFGKGKRLYVLVRYHPDRQISISGKYTITQKEEVSSIGSGLNEISGDADDRLSIQLDIRI
jgi:hypothetical protein